MNLFVSVGTQKFPFDRLMKAVDGLTEHGFSAEDIFVQKGNSTYTPKHFPSAPFISKEEFAKRIRECDLLITHGGVSAIVSALQCGKKVIVVPRLAAYGEHVDDHQLQIARTFSEQGLVLCFEHGANDLFTLIQQAQHTEFAPYRSGRSKAVETLRQFIESCRE